MLPQVLSDVNFCSAEAESVVLGSGEGSIGVSCTK